MHGLRDLLTKIYAYRHNMNEVIKWFELENYKIIDVQSPTEHQKLFGKRLYGIGMTGKKNNKNKETEIVDL